MSKEFSIEVNKREVLSAMDKLGDFSGIAENDATKRATKELQSYLVQTTKKTVNIKVGRIKEALKVNPRAGKITISGRAPTLFQFLTPAQQSKLGGNMYRDPKKKGIAIRYFKDRPRVPVEGTFLIRGRGGNPLVVRRKEKNNPRSKLEALYGRWTRDLWEVRTIRQGAFAVTQEKFSQRFTDTFNKLKKGVF